MLSKRGKLVMLGLGLILLPIIEYIILQASYSKRYMLVSLGPNGFEIILTLLTKGLAFYIQAFIIKIRVLRLEWPIKFVSQPNWSLIPSLFNPGLYKLSE